MKPISINLASRPFYNHTLYLVVYAVSLAILVGMTGLNVYSFTADQLALGRMAEARLGLEREMAGLERQEARIRRELKGISLSEFDELCDPTTSNSSMCGLISLMAFWRFCVA